MKSLFYVCLISAFLSANAHAGWFSELFKGSTKVGAKSGVVAGAKSEAKSGAKETTKVVVVKTTSATSVALMTTATMLIAQAGLAEIDGYPVHEEVAKAISEGKKEFQTKVCKDGSGVLRTLPKDFTKCPFEGGEIKYGPILPLNQ